jgi:Ser-tRNA(Ala) deacylase AlaX
MTEPLFWRDAYMKEFSAHILSIRDGALILDRTCFFPEGGGQVSDSGTLNGVRVTNVCAEGDEILHLVEDLSCFKEGQEVRGVIDWEKRYKIMRLHSAAHVVFFCFRAKFDPDCTASSGRVDDEKERSDYLFAKELLPDVLKTIEDCANETIARGLDVKIWFEDAEAREVNPWTGAAAHVEAGLRRKWRIESFPEMECGGTHVKNTSEIGRIILKKGKNPGRGRKRIEVYLA